MLDPGNFSLKGCKNKAQGKRPGKERTDQPKALKGRNKKDLARDHARRSPNDQRYVWDRDSRALSGRDRFSSTYSQGVALGWIL
jgi:hypothetical protein